MSKEPNRNVYVGHRYVPKVFGEWDNSNEYEGLSIVTNKGTSYTSKKRVPVGIDIKNEEFWAVTGNYNAQIEHYREDVKKLEGNISNIDKKFENELNNVDEMLGRRAEASTENTNIYVDGSGNDSNNGSSALLAVKTFDRALELIPDVIRRGHVYSIKIGSGLDDQQLILEDKVINGELIIEGMSENKDMHKIYRLFLDKLTGWVQVRNLTTTIKEAKGQSIRVRRCPFVDVYNVLTENNPDIERGVEGVIGLLADYGSNVRVVESEFSGKRYGVRSNYLSRVFVSRCTGSNNTFGVGARWGGIAQVYGTHPTGTTNNLTAGSSGMIIENNGFRAGLPNEPHLISSEKTGVNGSHFKKNYLIADINNKGVDISSSQQIRITFRVINHGYYFIKLKYGGQTTSSGGSQGVGVTFGGLIGQTEFNRPKKTTDFENLLSPDNVEFNHIGNNRFEIIIKPLQALAGRWAVDIETTLTRRLSGTILEDVVVEDK